MLLLQLLFNKDVLLQVLQPPTGKKVKEWKMKSNEHRRISIRWTSSTQPLLTNGKGEMDRRLRDIFRSFAKHFDFLLHNSNKTKESHSYCCDKQLTTMDTLNYVARNLNKAIDAGVAYATDNAVYIAILLAVAYYLRTNGM